jgi:biotin operon repressor
LKLSTYFLAFFDLEKNDFHSVEVLADSLDEAEEQVPQTLKKLPGGATRFEFRGVSS